MHRDKDMKESALFYQGVKQFGMKKTELHFGAEQSQMVRSEGVRSGVTEKWFRAVWLDFHASRRGLVLSNLIFLSYHIGLVRSGHGMR